jgi:heterodisulfide reductase subunit B
MDGVAYFPGCSLKDDARAFERSALAVMDALGLPLVELPRWTCCGTVASLATDDLMHHVASVRNLVRTQEAGGRELVAACSMCFNTLKQVAARVNADAEAREKLNAFMDEEPDYDGGVTVLHLLELLRDRIGWEAIADRVVEPLTDRPIGAYYGCTLVRPKAFGIDRSDRPRVLGDLLEALGAQVLPTPFDTECCGSYHIVDRRDLAVDRSIRVLRAMRQAGVRVIATSCPLCEHNLRAAANSELGREALGGEPPVVAYFTELMALAFGLESVTASPALRAALEVDRDAVREGA